MGGELTSDWFVVSVPGTNSTPRRPAPRRSPVAFTDRRGGFTETYSNFKAISSWPAGTFDKPAGCK